MSASKWLEALRRDQRGNALILCVATLPLLLGSAAAAVDIIQLSLSKRQMQRAADSGALAGAFAVAQRKGVAASVERDLTLNSRVPLSETPVIQNAPTVGPFKDDARAVRVELTAQRSLPFLSFFTSTPTTIGVEATARVVSKGKYCMVALEEGNVTGITFTGNAEVKLGCGIVSNSSSSEAVQAGGSSKVTASPVSAVGGVADSDSYTDGTEIIPHVTKQPDPYAGLPVPAPTNCQAKVSVGKNDTVTLTPGCYKGIDVKGRLELDPGIYYIADDAFSVGAQGEVVGTNVTIILTSTTPSSSNSFATLDIGAGATLDLSAPTSGTYEGLLFYQDPRAPYTDVKVNGNADSRLAGAFYFPSASLTFNGNSGSESTCIQMIARRLTFSGNSSLINNCPPGSPEGYDAIFVRLVG